MLVCDTSISDTVTVKFLVTVVGGGVERKWPDLSLGWNLSGPIATPHWQPRQLTQAFNPDLVNSGALTMPAWTLVDGVYRTVNQFVPGVGYLVYRDEP